VLNREFNRHRSERATICSEITQGDKEEQGVIPHFSQAHRHVSLDAEGVGELVTIAAERGRKTRPDLKLGVCGEHGGDPDSIAFCEQAQLDYVSCSPCRIPIARLAAAQAARGKKPASRA
jgi:pyruvate, orthophosphate dikinase